MNNVSQKSVVCHCVCMIRYIYCIVVHYFLYRVMCIIHRIYLYISDCLSLCFSSNASGDIQFNVPTFLSTGNQINIGTKSGVEVNSR